MVQIIVNGIDNKNIIIPRSELLKALEEIKQKTGITFSLVGDPNLFVHPTIKVENGQKKEFTEELKTRGLYLHEKGI